MRLVSLCLLSLLTFPPSINAQQNTDTQPATTDCTFDDGRQITIRYNPGKGEEPRNGKLWEPGGSPMILFSQAALSFGGATIAPGAYTVYTIPGKKEWTLIVNRKVTAGGSYDASQDLAHASMDTGEIDHAEKQLQVSFAHMAPKVCNLRMYIGKVGAFTDLKEP